MSTMNDILDEQYQQFKLETSQVSSEQTDEKLWTEQNINKNIVQKIHLLIENGRNKKKHHIFLRFLSVYSR